VRGEARDAAEKEKRELKRGGGQGESSFEKRKVAGRKEGRFHKSRASKAGPPLVEGNTHRSRANVGSVRKGSTPRSGGVGSEVWRGSPYLYAERRRR